MSCVGDIRSSLVSSYVRVFGQLQSPMDSLAVAYSVLSLLNNSRIFIISSLYSIPTKPQPLTDNEDLIPLLTIQKLRL